MTTVIINNNLVLDKYIPDIARVDFNYLGDKVYSATKVEKMVAVFVSQIVYGVELLISWKNLSATIQKFEGTDVWIYLRSSTTEAGIVTASWNGPYLNAENDISDLKGMYLQFMVVLMNNSGTGSVNYDNIVVGTTPIVSSISLSYLSSETAAKFYTKSFNLGFVPKHVLLTYNGDIPDDSIVRFAISGFDSVDATDYQYIDPNKIEELSGLSVLSDKIKVFIEMIGNSGVPTVIHEFALMFSGDDQLYLNNVSTSSSSSSSSSIDSSSSSSSNSSSSSSIDSSSSSSSNSSSSSSSNSSSSSSLSSHSSSSSGPGSSTSSATSMSS